MQWGSWGEWFEGCENKCGKHEDTRLRICLNGIDCPGTHFQNRACFKKSCVGTYVCTWNLGSGKPGSKDHWIKAGMQNGDECIQACVTEKETKNKWINGVEIYSANHPGCWCFENMTSIDAKGARYQSCFLNFVSAPTTAAPEHAAEASKAPAPAGNKQPAVKTHDEPEKPLNLAQRLQAIEDEVLKDLS